ncbi:MAG: ATP-binding cassette domain-containing protein, partial [Spirochaetaceae bacterium]|nr:ATP-binding cassette domain-containing protein [Spirochaetaceae bacterium]
SLEAAAQAAEISGLVNRLPDGLDTVIGTHGIKLSVGEKQRISIARAILKDPLILIMDEATSSLDSESEALIQRALERVLHGRTSFVVAHRLSTITSADTIVVMDFGAIIEQGSHGELMKIPGGHYRKLYEELQGQAQEADL